VAPSPPWADGLGNPRLADHCGLDWIWDRDVECLGADDLRAASSEVWRKQAEGLQARSPFLRRKMLDAGVDLRRVQRVDDLARVPLTTKAELARSQEDEPPFGSHLAVDPGDVKRVYQTSGTSGRPSLLALTWPDVVTWRAIGARSYYATGLHPHNSLLSTFGAGPFVAGHTHGVADDIGVRSVPVGPGDTARVLSTFERGIVDTTLGTPSFALYLASLFAERGLDGPGFGVTHLISGGEPGGGVPTIRDHIEAAFGARVTEMMGLGDVAPSLFGECPMQQGMHFSGQGLVWPELIDQHSGEPVEIEPGAVGEAVYTSLEREAMPVVRFRSGDLLQVLGTSCECGRTGFRMRCLGRTDDMFIVRGVNVYPSAIQDVVGRFRPRVTGRLRVVRVGDAVSIDPPVPVEAELPAGGTQDTALAESIASAIRSTLLFRADVRLVRHGEFGDAAYKTRLTRRAKA
jgi:phenylacetate-CoA ligase